MVLLSGAAGRVLNQSRWNHHVEDSPDDSRSGTHLTEEHQRNAVMTQHFQKNHINTNQTNDVNWAMGGWKDELIDR